MQTADEWAEKMPKGPPPPVPKDPAIRETLVRLHKAVAAHVHAITQEFENFDTMKTSTVSRDEFRAVCTRHIQILTDEQVRCTMGPRAQAEPTGEAHNGPVPGSRQDLRAAPTHCSPSRRGLR